MSEPTEKLSPRLVRIDLCDDECIDFVYEDGTVASFFDSSWSFYQSEKEHAEVMGLTEAEYRSDMVTLSVPVLMGDNPPSWIRRHAKSNYDHGVEAARFLQTVKGIFGNVPGSPLVKGGSEVQA